MYNKKNQPYVIMESSSSHTPGVVLPQDLCTVCSLSGLLFPDPHPKQLTPSCHCTHGAFPGRPLRVGHAGSLTILVCIHFTTSFFSSTSRLLKYIIKLLKGISFLDHFPTRTFFSM